MSSSAVATLIKMVESLPEPAQEQVVEHLREYLADMQDELKWDNLYKTTQNDLVSAARRAKKQIAEGRAEPLDYDRL
jgi:hypothetical protein